MSNFILIVNKDENLKLTPKRGILTLVVDNTKAPTELKPEAKETKKKGRQSQAATPAITAKSSCSS